MKAQPGHLDDDCAAGLAMQPASPKPKPRDGQAAEPAQPEQDIAADHPIVISVRLLAHQSMRVVRSPGLVHFFIGDKQSLRDRFDVPDLAASKNTPLPCAGISAHDGDLNADRLAQAFPETPEVQRLLFEGRPVSRWHVVVAHTPAASATAVPLDQGSVP